VLANRRGQPAADREGIALSTSAVRHHAAELPRLPSVFIAVPPVIRRNRASDEEIRMMSVARRVLASALLLLVAACAQPGPAPTEQQALVEESRITFDKLITHPDFGELPDFVKRSKAIVIFPSLVKGGVVIGGEGGDGVLVVRDPSRGWSDPAFYTLAAGSLGLQ